MEVERVQEIASLSMTINSIPLEYIRSENEQPAITTVHGSALEVPWIDLDNPDEHNVIELVTKASSEWGLFQIVNHGISTEIIRELQEVGRTFFELPAEEKEAYARLPDSKSMEGYGTKLQKEVEGKKAWVDHLFHRTWPPSIINYKFWPSNPPNYREANEKYTEALRKVADKLFRSLSLGLGLEANDVKEAVGGDNLEYMLKINYYPPCPRPDLALGVVAHTDMSTFTILVPNDVPGLQVCREGHWYDVNYIPDALIVHIGDQLEILSNGKIKAVLHRTTVKKEKTRMSWPVFLEPPADQEIGPHPKLVDEGNPAKYKTKKYGEYVYCKLNKIPQ
ncbi:Flavonol synthase/flavanone 3-hydroxylase-like protein [Drosera capensis]